MEQSTVDEMLAWSSSVRLASVAEKLRARGFEAEVCATREELLGRLDAAPVEDALVLVKGSRGIGLEKALEKL